MATPDENTLLSKKLLRYAKLAGRSLVENVLLLVYIMRDPDTPLWAKGSIGSALAYFISPLDLIPDFVPLAGYSDDATVLAAALASVVMFAKKEHRELAKKQADNFFGPTDPRQHPPSA